MRKLFVPQKLKSKFAISKPPLLLDDADYTHVHGNISRVCYDDHDVALKSTMRTWMRHFSELEAGTIPDMETALLDADRRQRADL